MDVPLDEFIHTTVVVVRSSIAHDTILGEHRSWSRGARRSACGKIASSSCLKKKTWWYYEKRYCNILNTIALLILSSAKRIRTTTISVVRMRLEFIRRNKQSVFFISLIFTPYDTITAWLNPLQQPAVESTPKEYQGKC